MPIYSYKCSKCGQKFEELVGVEDSPEGLKCTSCGSGKVKKIFSTFSVGKSSEKASPGCGGPQCPSGCSLRQD